MGYESNGPGGVRQWYGAYDVDKGSTSCVRVAGEEYELVTKFDFANLPVADNGAANAIIPENSTIVSAVLFVTEAFAGGTSYDIGVTKLDGTGGDPDGLFAGTLLASLTLGAVIAGDGTLLPVSTTTTAVPSSYASVGSSPVQISAAATGTFTAGKAKLVVKYLKSDTGIAV